MNKKAGDNIWSREVIVPLDAPADTYHLEIPAKDTNGNEIITPGLEQQQFGRSGSVEVVVEKGDMK